MIVGSYVISRQVISRQVISPVSAEEQAWLMTHIVAFLPLYIAVICILLLILYSPICNRFFEDEERRDDCDHDLPDP